MSVLRSARMIYPTDPAGTASQSRASTLTGCAFVVRLKTRSCASPSDESAFLPARSSTSVQTMRATVQAAARSSSGSRFS